MTAAVMHWHIQLTIELLERRKKSNLHECGCSVRERCQIAYCWPQGVICKMLDSSNLGRLTS